MLFICIGETLAQQGCGAGGGGARVLAGPGRSSVAKRGDGAYDSMSRRPRETLVRMAEYKVKFEVFEGPLDLLLYLIKKEEVDIYEVNLTRLATQFIEYIETMRMLDLEIAGEFLVMAATLMYIKSRELLPADQQAQAEGEEEGEDPRWELIRQLVEYKKFKDAAAQLQVLEARQEDVFPRTPVSWSSRRNHRRARKRPSSIWSTQLTSSSNGLANGRTSGISSRTSGRSARRLNS